VIFNWGEVYPVKCLCFYLTGAYFIGTILTQNSYALCSMPLILIYKWTFSFEENLMVSLEELVRIAEIEFFDIVDNIKRVGTKLRKLEI
jgi:hypothetical protein